MAKMHSRRRFLGYGLGLGVLATVPFALPACAQPRALALAIHPWPGYMLMRLGAESGALPATSVHFMVTRSATESLVALRSGEAMAACLTLDEMLRARSSGLSLTAVGVFNVSAGADALLAGPLFADFEQLRGKRIGVELHSTGELLLQLALKKAGIPPGDITWVDVDASKHIATITSGSVDAIVTYEPYLGQLEAAGYRRIFDSRALPATIIDVLAVRSEQLESQRLHLQEAMTSHFRGRQSLLTNPVDSTLALGKCGIDQASVPVDSLFGGLLLPSLSSNIAYLQPRTGEVWQAADTISAFFQATGVIARADDLHELATTRCLPSS